MLRPPSCITLPCQPGTAGEKGACRAFSGLQQQEGKALIAELLTRDSHTKVGHTQMPASDVLRCSKCTASPEL